MAGVSCCWQIPIFKDGALQAPLGDRATTQFTDGYDEAWGVCSTTTCAPWRQLFLDASSTGYVLRSDVRDEATYLGLAVADAMAASVSHCWGAAV